MSSKLSKKVRSRRNLEAAWRVIYKNGRSSNSQDVRGEIAKFAEDPTFNLNSIQHRLSRGKFIFEKAKGVPISKAGADGKPTGKIRPIVLAPLATRIVQRAVLNVLTEQPKLRLYFDTQYSFGGVRKASMKEDVDSAVPGAIKAVLDAVEHGAKYSATADISEFFTKIPKPHVRSIIASCIDDAEFISLYDRAVKVELHNLDLLRGHVSAFPIHEIGVAQGNSISPLLGNIILRDFDVELNSKDCRCVRYIDDFIILGPSAKAVNANLARAKEKLHAFKMTLQEGKSDASAIPIERGMSFLGIQICPGIIRPDGAARRRLLERVDADLHDSLRAMRSLKNGGLMDQQQALIFALRRVEGRLNGWRKHYWFCNDREFFGNLNKSLDGRIQAYLGQYRDLRAEMTDDRQRQLLGLTDLRLSDRAPFRYPGNLKVKAP